MGTSFFFSCCFLIFSNRREMDPFAFIVQGLEKPVRVHTVSNETVDGTLLAVDDHCNVMLRGWKVVGHDTKGVEGPASSSLLAPIRFIRGAQIKTITLVQ
ncbi:U6 snRNA-associated Sm-like protein LSm3p [Trypanosoma cruzi]|uniref:U6 snRNA-associated Sm-like protein LSm3p n=2 Tax=Trypanosoma cruzi TaxID=5693 RepID=Q4DJM5_TRYCC|nr:U6 snRNA-associated Sm-like protein LSm3p [Trypanosoma cruzi]EAN92732.1 U6 snRNA-associated Sm-like protein LSm3p [Trypanosoma cruzi]RNC54631.1 U6 snRNA-associated Sm-like protein LSm3p [Trypanosoma cruzi]|eukprot:XP_814583.1 U6 snRNA-associated Sm-like protein LSm3p [Trypanosoma cruzi strain CL Brener]